MPDRRLDVAIFGHVFSLIGSMTRPPNPANVLLALVVWLTFPLIAAAVLLLPLHRLLVPSWPDPVVEWIDGSGRLELRIEGGSWHDDAVRRARPLHAVRVDFKHQSSHYGYVVGLRREGVDREAPDRGWWRPDGPCELGLSDVGRVEQIEWIDCSEIQRVVWPNRLAWVDRLVLAGRHVIDSRFDPN